MPTMAEMMKKIDRTKEFGGLEKKEKAPQSFQTVNKLSGGTLSNYQHYIDKTAGGEFTVGGVLNTFDEEKRRNPMMHTEEMSLLEKSLDYLSRGNYAAAEAVMGLVEQEQIQDIWARAGRGIRGESKTSFIDVMDNVMGGRNPWVNIPIGFAADVILDPINLVPMSWPKAIGRMLRLPELIRAADNITHLSKAAKKASHVVGDLPGIRWAGKAFKPGYSLRKHPGAYRLYRDVELKIASIKRNVQEDLTKKWDLFRQATKALGVDGEWAAAEMIRGHEGRLLGKTGADLGDEIRDLFRIEDTMQDPDAMQILKDSYTDITKGFAQMALDETKAGVLNPKKVLNNYFPHIFEKGKLKLTPEGKWKAKGQYGFFTSLKYRGTPFFSRKREFTSLEDAKLWLAGHAVGGQTIPVPIEHWFRGYAVRRFVGESAVAWKGFIDDALTKFGTPIEGMFEEAAKKAGYRDFAQALAAKESGFDKIWGIVKTSLPKGHRLVLPTTALKSHAATKLSEKMLKETLGDTPTELEKIFKEHGPNFLYHLFKNTKGKGLHVDVSDEMVKAMSAKNVYLMPTEVADHIKDSFKVFSTDEQVKGFVGAMDGAMHLWKSMATSLRLPFHHRNGLSNTWQMYLSGVKAPMIPVRLAQAARIQLKDKKFMFQGFNVEELNEIANRYGVRAFGWIAADVPRMFQKELFVIAERSAAMRKVGAGINPYNPAETAMRLGRKYGTFIEDNARLGAFLNHLKKEGITKSNMTKERISRSAEHVKKYMFDYTELTPFERNVMKRIFPFYTWMRKNIPLQLESLVTQPHKYARLADMERDLFPLFTEPETKAEAAIRPKWLDEMRARKVKGWETENGDPIYTWIDLPSGDLHKIQKLGKFLSSSVNPLLVLFDTARNVRSWPSPGKLGEPGQKLVAPWYVQFLPEKDWGVMGIEPVRNKKTGKTVLGIDPQWKYALNTALPFLNDWETMHPGGVELGVRREGQTLPGAISYLTGIKFKPMHKGDQALQKYYKTQEFQRNIRRAGKVQKDLTASEIGEIFRQTMK